LSQISWAQSSDTLLLLHPDVTMMQLKRTNATTYTLTQWAWLIESNVVVQPYFKFADAAVTLTPSATSGNITVTASAAVFSAAYVGTRWRIGGREIAITAVASGTSASATVIQTLSTTTATTLWQEPAFSTVRGYPTTACFHQDRLVIGGSRDLPNRIWMSQTGDITNFFKGTGLDSQSIEFGILSDQANAIRGLYSGRDLQIFTNGAEYVVASSPLTPITAQIRRQTRVGSITSRYLPPLSVDGASLFMARNGQELREFTYTDSAQSYRSNDMALLAKHMLVNPVDQCYDPRRRILYVVRGDGKIAALTIQRTEDILAWTLCETDGTVTSIANTGDETYAIILRGSQYFLERFDDVLRVDAGLTLTSGTAATTWTGLSHLNGQTVRIVADGNVLSSQTVSSGQITISPAAITVEIGLPYRHIIEPLPPSLTGVVANAKNVRMIEATFRLLNTSALRLDVGRGLRNVILKSGQPAILPTTSPLTIGDISVSAFGWSQDLTKPLWMIDQDHPVPFTLLGVKSEIKIND
jgi:hypothetical protein